MKTASSAHACTPQTPAKYIKNLPAWDGVPRLGQWLSHVLDESTLCTRGQISNRMQYLSQVGYQWLLGMVGRALTPGTTFNHCLVLEGPAGTRKSSLLRALAGADFYSDRAISMDTGAVTQQEMDSVWLYEIAELNAFDRADKHNIKAFITACKDAYRPPYTTKTKSAPRQFVVAATSNDGTWRAGEAGGQFWPVIVRQKINTQWMVTHRDQLFAEALLRLQQGEQPQLPNMVADFHFWNAGGAE